MNFRMDGSRSTALYYVGAVGVALAASSWNWSMAAVAMLVHILAVSIFSAVTHRYFSHRAYEANRSLMTALSLFPMAYGYASPLSWAALHSAHHAFADTDRDSHYKGWKGIFTAMYRNPPLRSTLAGKWFQTSSQEFVHRNALLIVVVWHSIVLFVSPTAYLWIVLVPTFTLHFFNGLHRAFSHQGNKVMNRWYLEYLIPMGGEWIHDEHHANARKPIYRNRWYELDTGGLLVKALSK